MSHHYIGDYCIKDFPNNGIYKFENFVVNVSNGRAIIRRLDMKVCNLEEWYLYIKTETDNRGNVTFNPLIKCNAPMANHQKYLNIHILCKIINNNDDEELTKAIEGFSIFKYITRIGHMPTGCKMTMARVMDEKNKWLENGALSIEIGIYVESVQWKNGIRTFNFYDKTCDYYYEQNKVTMEQQNHDQRLYAHNQLLAFHSTLIKDKCTGHESEFYILKEEDMALLEKCLQIAHGVQLKLPYYEIADIIHIAWELKLSNAIRYCERQLIEMEIEFNILLFRNAITYNLNSYLKHLLTNKKDLDMIKLILRFDTQKKMSSESMKTKLVYDVI